jgi:hypothetical protein
MSSLTAFASWKTRVLPPRLTHISRKADGHVCEAPKEPHFTCHVWSGRRRGMVQLSTGPTVHRSCIKLMKPELSGRVTAVRISYIMPISLRIRHTRCSLQRRPSLYFLVRDMTPSEEKALVKVYSHRGVRLVGCNLGR